MLMENKRDGKKRNSPAALEAERRRKERLAREKAQKQRAKEPEQAAEPAPKAEPRPKTPRRERNSRAAQAANRQRKERKEDSRLEGLRQKQTKEAKQRTRHRLGPVFWRRLIIIVAVAISKLSDFKANPKQMLLCVAVFFFNGLVGVISKVHQVEVNYPVVSAAAFTVLVNFWKMVLSGAAYGAMFKKLREQPKLPPLRKTYPYVVGCTLTGGIYYILQLLLAGKVSASVMFPMMTGGNIIFSALLGKAILHENLSKRAIVGIILCFVGTCMFL